MTAPIPKVEPDRVSAGMTWAWRREDLGDYPASAGWSLKYQFRSNAAGFNFAATADVDAFAVSVDAATTAGYAAGSYAWLGWVEKGSEKYEVGRGTMIVAPALGAGDPRTHARKVLDAIEAVIENRATLDQMSYEISVAGSMRRLGRTPLADLVNLRKFYRGEVKREEREDRARRGLPSRRRILTQFVRPS